MARISAGDPIPRRYSTATQAHYVRKIWCKESLSYKNSITVAGLTGTVDCRLISGLRADGRDNTIMC